MRNRNIKKYLSLTGGILTSTIVNSAIIYTDVDPDKTLSQSLDSFQIDFNNDSITDIIISNLESSKVGSTLSYYGYSTISYGYFTNGVFANVKDGNGIVGMSTATSYGYYNTNQLTPVFDGDTISPNNTFLEKETTLLSFTSGYWGTKGSWSYTNGNFADSIVDKYIGVRFGINSIDTAYGWVRIRCEASKGVQSFTIYDYAYEDFPLFPLPVGAGIPDPNAKISEKLTIEKVYISNHFLNINIGELNSASLQIIDVSGRLVLEEKLNSNLSKINIKHLKQGIYIINIKNSSDFYSKKVKI